MIDKLLLYFSYPFVRYALIVGVLIALCSSLLGVTLVLKRFSFIGDGLSHVAFGAMAIASVLNLTSRMLLVLPLTVLCAVLLLRTGQNTKIKGDAAIAMISVGALAFGYLLMNLFSTSTNLSGDVCSTLFGSTSILTLTRWEVWLCVVLSIIVVIVFILYYNKIFAVTFDENFSRAVGTKVDAYNLLIAVTIAVIIVLAMNLVGSLLISALVIFPALSAMRVFKNFRAVTICSAVVSVGCSFAGILISILAGTPVGSTIVAIDVLVFFLFCLAGKLGSSHSAAAGVLTVMVIGVMLSGLTGCGGSKAGGVRETKANAVDAIAAQMTAEDGAPEDAGSETENAAAADQAVTGPTAASGEMPLPEMDIDVDLSQLSGTMVYSEVFNMMTNPDDYVGKTIRMVGDFNVYEDETHNRNYYTCRVADATACCVEGIEFLWKGDHTYPEDYPEPGDIIWVQGTFNTYDEDGYEYSQLEDADVWFQS